MMPRFLGRALGGGFLALCSIAADPVFAQGDPAPGPVRVVDAMQVPAEAPVPVPVVRAPEAEGSATVDAASRVVPHQDFVKGELSTFLGSDRLVTKNNRIGMSLGYFKVSDEGGSVHYLHMVPQLDLRLGELTFGVGVPLNLEAYDTHVDAQGQRVGTANQWRVRRQDWADRSAYAQALIYLTYGHKEDHLYLNVGQRYASTIGHGAVLRRYAPNIDVNFTRVSAQLDAYNDYAGFEVMTNDVLRWNLVGLLAFVKPLSLAGVNGTAAKSLSLGFSYVADFQAPLSLSLDSDGRPALEGSHLAGQLGTVSLMGVDAEIKVVKTEHSDIKPYVDYSWLVGGGGGFTAGVLGRFNFGEGTVHALRTVVEARAIGSHYQPGYFDTFYEIDKWLFGTSAVGPMTKIQAVKGQDQGRAGYFVEASYGVRKAVGLTVSLEGASDSPNKNFVAHLELPAVDLLQFFASYYKRGFSNFETLTTLDRSSIAFAGARLKVLPILFLNGRAFKTFALSTDTRAYESSSGYALDAELGLEF